MKTNKKLILAGVATVFSLGLAPELQAQNTPRTTLDRDQNATSAIQADRTDLDRDHTVGTAQPMPVSKVNKASNLIGMDVRNAQNEKLGDIKDLVVDLHSGKIAYAVLSVGGFLGIGDKYVAVPPSAFSVAPDQDSLALNADKAKIQNAPGFAKSDWPDLNSPLWYTHSQYWNPEGTAQGTAGTVRSGTGAADLDRDRARSSSRLDRSDSALSRNANRSMFHGRITAVNPESRMVTVEGDSGSREFKLTERGTITLKDNRNPRLTDLKVGYPVTVRFHEDNGQFVADQIIRSDAPEVK
jgi:sporulation protein YlmC with PRC-barrel domain